MLRTPSSNPAMYVNLASVYHNIGIYLLSAQNKRKIPAIIKPQEPGGHRPRQGEVDEEEVAGVFHYLSVMKHLNRPIPVTFTCRNSRPCSNFHLHHNSPSWHPHCLRHPFSIIC